MSASLKDVIEADKVSLNIRIRILDRITNSCLSRKVNYNLRLKLIKRLVDNSSVSNVTL